MDKRKKSNTWVVENRMKDSKYANQKYLWLFFLFTVAYTGSNLFICFSPLIQTVIEGCLLKKQHTDIRHTTIHKSISAKCVEIQLV